MSLPEEGDTRKDHIAEGFESFRPDDSFSIGLPPDWVLDRTVLWETPSLPDEHVTFLLLDTQHSPGRKLTFERNIRRLVTAEAVQKLSHLEIDYDSKTQNLIVHRLLVWRNGHARNFAERPRFFFRQREGSLESQILHGRVSAMAVLDDVRTGDCVEIAYSIVSIREIFGKKTEYAFSLDRPVRIAAWTITIHLPDGEPVQFRQSDGADAAPEISRGEQATILHWSGRQEEAFRGEAGVPSFAPAERWVQISGYKSWAEVAAILHANWQKAMAEDTETRGFARTLTLPTADLLTKATQAIRWVQDEVRYLGLEMGLGGIVPSSPDQVLRRRYGDCKDKSLLLCALLQTYGIESHPLLVGTGFRSSIRHQLPSPSAFNHAIVAFVLDGNYFFADPTASGSGGDACHQALPDYGVGLLVDSATTELLKILGNLPKPLPGSSRKSFISTSTALPAASSSAFKPPVSRRICSGPASPRLAGIPLPKTKRPICTAS